VATASWDEAYRSVEHHLGGRIAKIETFGLEGQDLRVLDLGCGDGVDLEAFKQLGFRQVVGIDLSRTLLGQLDRDGSALINSDVYALGVKDASFDVVYGNNVLHHFLDLDAAFAEIRRVLRRGGLFCFAEPNDTLFRRLVDEVTLSPLARLVPLLAHRRIILEEEMADYRTWLRQQPELCDRLERRGFARLQVRSGLFRLYGKWRAI
jgi:ubiquinone/menaquinone biosynthesis C-methylase UbiE